MNFLIIHNRYSRAGGEESVVAEQCELLASHGHSVTLYERSYDEIRSWRTGRVGALFSSLYNRRSVREIHKVLIEQKIDIALIHNLFPVVSPAVLPVLHKAGGVRVIMMLHNFRLVCPTGLFFREGTLCEKCGQSPVREWQCVSHRCEGSLLGSMAFALRSYWARSRGYYTTNVDLFCALSDFQLNKLASYGVPRSRMAVLSNPVKSLRQNDDNPKRDKFIGFVGRFSEEKGAYLLMDVARRLPNITFKVAGTIMIPLGEVPKNIEFVGFLDRDELDHFYRTARAVLSASVCYETFGLVVAEAMAAGAVGIVPRMAAMPELVDGGKAGLIYVSGSVDALSLCVEQIVTDDQLFEQLSLAGREYIANKYSSENYYRDFISLCNSILPESI